MGKIKYSTESYIEKAAKKHNYKYDYSKTTYCSKEKIEIICPNHGSFFVKAALHLHKTGCPSCGIEARNEKSSIRWKKNSLKIEEFLIMAQKVHDRKYDYSQSDVDGIRSKIKIICPEHGVFTQMVQAHITNGQGCPACYKRLRSWSSTKKLPNKPIEILKKEYFDKANKVHENMYCYDETDLEMKDDQGKIKIICNFHGSFFVRPADHINKKLGCEKCRDPIEQQKFEIKGPALRQTEHLSRLKISNLLGDGEFLSRAKNIHGNRYNYEQVNYTGLNRKVKIICLIHGIFEQTPREHFDGSGCQKCANFATSVLEKKWLDALGIEKRQYKIKLDNSYVIVDGYDQETNTIYEFLGDYWHGNPRKYDLTKKNERSKKTFGQLYENTNKRIARLQQEGYNVIIKWESDFKDENHLQARRPSPGK